MKPAREWSKEMEGRREFKAQTYSRDYNGAERGCYVIRLMHLSTAKMIHPTCEPLCALVTCQRFPSLRD